MRVHFYLRDAKGYFAGAGTVERPQVTLADVQAEYPGLTVLDADKEARPPSDPAKAEPDLAAEYAAATTVEAKLDIIAKRQGLM